jgi:tripartite-type tricarboxylate transporter receptor subunit TctC
MPSRSFARRSLLAGAACTSLLTPLSRAHAQTTLPDKGLQMLTGFVTGGGTDIIARRIAVAIERRVGRHVVVANRPGGIGSVPGEMLKRDSGDGSVVALLASTTLVSGLMIPNFPFDPLTDLAPISLAGTWPMALAVSPKLGIRTFEEYLAWAKGDDAQRRRLGSTASDGFIQAFSLMVGKEVGIKFEPAPYRGSAPMVYDLQDGRLDAAVSGLVSLLEQHRGGRVRLLMTTAPKRLETLPNVPTARELGYPGLEDLEWFGFFSSAKTPAPLIEEWNRQITAVLTDPAQIAELAQFGMSAETTSPRDTAARIVDHLTRWKAVMQSVGMRPVN